MSPSLVTLLSCTVTKLMGSKIHFLFLSPSNDLSRNSWMSKRIDFTIREKSLRNGYFLKTKIFFLFRVWKNNGRDDLMTPTCFDAKSSRQHWNWIKRDQCMKISRDIIFKPYVFEGVYYIILSAVESWLKMREIFMFFIIGFNLIAWV